MIDKQNLKAPRVAVDPDAEVLSIAGYCYRGGKGGYAWVDSTLMNYKSEPVANTSLSRMMLASAIESLCASKKRKVILYSGSSVFVNLATRQWPRRSDFDLWKILDRKVAEKDFVAFKFANFATDPAQTESLRLAKECAGCL